MQNLANLFEANNNAILRKIKEYRTQMTCPSVFSTFSN